MKYVISFAFAFLILSGTAVAGDFPYLTTALVKTYHTTETWQEKEVDVMIRILTDSNVEPSDRKRSVLYALKYHDMLCNAFLRRGWRMTHPLSENLDAGTLELTFEPRMRHVVMKTFIYPCDSEKLWNMMKYRGGSKTKYFNRVVQKAMGCIADKFRVR